MQSPGAFRLLVVSSLIGILGPLIDASIPGLIPASLHEEQLKLASAARGPLVLVSSFLALVAAIGGLVATIGLVIFKRWARTLGLVSTVAVLAMLGLTPGPYIQSGPNLALFYLSAALWGGALAAAYWSPIRDRFA